MECKCEQNDSDSVSLQNANQQYVPFDVGFSMTKWNDVEFEIYHYDADTILTHNLDMYDVRVELSENNVAWSYVNGSNTPDIFDCMTPRLLQTPFVLKANTLLAEFDEMECESELNDTNSVLSEDTDIHHVPSFFDLSVWPYINLHLPSCPWCRLPFSTYSNVKFALLDLAVGNFVWNMWKLLRKYQRLFHNVQDGLPWHFLLFNNALGVATYYRQNKENIRLSVRGVISLLTASPGTPCILDKNGQFAFVSVYLASLRAWTWGAYTSPSVADYTFVYMFLENGAGEADEHSHIVHKPYFNRCHLDVQYYSCIHGNRDDSLK